MAPYTAAAFLQEAGGRVEASARFERAAGDGPDASRSVWCLSVRLYTGQGPLDLLGAHLPIFPVRDAVKFPRALRALSGGADSLWRFVAENPEAFPFAVWYFSDLGTVGSLRHHPRLWKPDLPVAGAGGRAHRSLPLDPGGGGAMPQPAGGRSPLRAGARLCPPATFTTP